MVHKVMGEIPLLRRLIHLLRWKLIDIPCLDKLADISGVGSCLLWIFLELPLCGPQVSYEKECVELLSLGAPLPQEGGCITQEVQEVISTGN